MEKEKILELLENFLNINKNPYFYSERNDYRVSVDKKDAPFAGFRSETWIVGGREGGDCWGHDANIPVSTEEPKEITLLDKFLEETIPYFSFINYKKLSKFIHTEDYSRSEYYGNYYEYRIAYIKFDDIAEFLASAKIEIK